MKSPTLLHFWGYRITIVEIAERRDFNGGRFVTI